MKKNIILFEDDPVISRAYKDVLEEEGFIVNVVTSGKEGLEMITKINPDLVVLDLIMPVKDGICLLEDLRKDSECKNKKVLVLSNLDSLSAIRKCEELGVIEYLVKANNSLQDVVLKIKKVLS